MRASGDMPKRCSHGMAWTEDCIECGLLWHRERLADAERSAARHRAAIERLLRRLALTKEETA